MRSTLAIAGAGAVGVLARHTVQQLVPRTGGVPWGTFIVNVSGALAIGLVFTVLVRRYEVALWIQEAVLVGFLGGYTTFSALSLETYVMIEHRRFGVALAYVGGSVVLGILAIFVGIRLGRAIS